MMKQKPHITTQNAIEEDSLIAEIQWWIDTLDWIDSHLEDYVNSTQFFASLPAIFAKYKQEKKLHPHTSSVRFMVPRMIEEFIDALTLEKTPTSLDNQDSSPDAPDVKEEQTSQKTSDSAPETQKTLENYCNTEALKTLLKKISAEYFTDKEPSPIDDAGFQLFLMKIPKDELKSYKIDLINQWSQLDEALRKNLIARKKIVSYLERFQRCLHIDTIIADRNEKLPQDQQMTTASITSIFDRTIKYYRENFTIQSDEWEKLLNLPHYIGIGFQGYLNIPQLAGVIADSMQGKIIPTKRVIRCLQFHTLLKKYRYNKQLQEQLNKSIQGFLAFIIDFTRTDNQKTRSFIRCFAPYIQEKTKKRRAQAPPAEKESSAKNRSDLYTLLSAAIRYGKPFIIASILNEPHLTLDEVTEAVQEAQDRGQDDIIALLSDKVTLIQTSALFSTLAAQKKSSNSPITMLINIPGMNLNALKGLLQIVVNGNAPAFLSKINALPPTEDILLPKQILHVADELECKEAVETLLSLPNITIDQIKMALTLAPLLNKECTDLLNEIDALEKDAQQGKTTKKQPAENK